MYSRDELLTGLVAFTACCNDTETTDKISAVERFIILFQIMFQYNAAVDSLAHS